ncbi:MAG: tyrosine recombinase XerC [Oscillospiraceae bacterium]|nr:tyrosine recombinase XerC [Oscillospiraceae bacterium]
MLREFLTYQEVVRGSSRKTVDEYFLDLRTFFRFLKILRGSASKDMELEDISISDVDVELVSSVTLTDVYAYMSYLGRDRVKNPRSAAPVHGVGAATRARKVASIRSFYKYLTTKAKLLKENPVQNLDAPKQKKDLPRYLTEEECLSLLSAVSGANKERDYCILTLFLNCGLRLSELVGLNLSGIQADSIRILGKGNKVRILYLNDACTAAINAYLPVRKLLPSVDKDAFFVTTRKERISTAAVHKIVKKYLLRAGLDAGRYSSHKLRHTAATLMLHNGVDVRTLQEILGHENLNTTQIYTHVDNEGLRVAVKANPLSKVRPK